MTQAAGNSKEIGVVGSPDFVLGFNLAGVRRTIAVESKDFPKAIEKILHNAENLGIVIVQDRDMAALPALLRKKASDSIEPVFVAMGDGAGQNDLREKVKRAIGIDIVK